MKKAAYKTTTFETEKEDFMIDIVEHLYIHEDEIEQEEMIRDIWLYRDSYGIKDYVIGEFEKYWQGKTVKQTAKEIIEYLEFDLNNDGQNWFEQYDSDHS